MLALGLVTGGMMWAARRANEAEAVYKASVPPLPIINPQSEDPIRAVNTSAMYGYDSAGYQLKDLIEPQTGYPAFRGELDIQKAKRAALQANTVEQSIALTQLALYPTEEQVRAFNLWRTSGPPSEGCLSNTNYGWQHFTSDYGTSILEGQPGPVRKRNVNTSFTPYTADIFNPANQMA